MRRLLFILLILISTVTCESNKPGKDLIAPEILVPVLVDLHLVYSIQTSPTFRTLSREVDSVDTHSYVFEKHEVTKVEFDSTIAWYTRHPKLFTQIYDEVVMELTQMADSLDIEIE